VLFLPDPSAVTFLCNACSRDAVLLLSMQRNISVNLAHCLAPPPGPEGRWASLRLPLFPLHRFVLLMILLCLTLRLESTALEVGSLPEDVAAGALAFV